jgi:hypothetical protein
MFIYDDNFLTEEEIIEIEKIFFDPDNRWSYRMYTQENDVNHRGVVNTGVVDIPYFTTAFNGEDDSYKPSLVKNMIDKFCYKNNISYRSLGRIKFNSTPWSKNSDTLYPHIDKNDPHLIFLYYINDCDGDTYIYNETFTGEIIKPPLTIMKQISPKRGSAFVSSGLHFHSISPTTTKSLRNVINANLNIDSY